ncbi:MAG: hypothetical protein ACO1N0_11625 [Fluviicola sp.]
MIQHLKLSFIGIAFWWVLLLPFDYALFDGIFKLIQKPFTGLLCSLDQDLIFETDTYGTYVLISLSILLGVLSSPLINRICTKWKLNMTELLKTVLAGILFFFLFKYGWDKITKTQFYQPEPNTLYTPFGKLSKDIAYWSLVGSSYSYAVSLGMIEVLAAIGLLFRRTRFLASLVIIGIFGQVFLINCSFDISVKLLSGSLFAFSLIFSSCFQQQWRGIFGFRVEPIEFTHSGGQNKIKFVFALLVIAESVFPSFYRKNFNDDQFPRLAHHGAYRVVGNPQIKYLFIHRQHYLILQSQNDVFKDYRIDTHLSDNYFTEDGEISCNWKENQLIIHSDTFSIKFIDHKNLPLLEDSFHTFSDEFH